MNLQETNCAFVHEGITYTADGALVTPELATVYVRSDGPPTPGKLISVSDWQGNHLGFGTVRTTWERYSSILGSCRWASVRFAIDGVTYVGRLNWDNGELVRGRRIKGGN